MLHAFLSANRDDLIDRCRLKVVQRRAPKATDVEIEHGIPHFLDQLIKTLQVEQTPEPMRSRDVSGESGGEGSVFSEIGLAAAQHGRELLQHGFTVDQVVHNYGDLCQAITDLAFEKEAPFEVDEFRTLNRCLDNAIADSVSEFTYQRDLLLVDAGAHALNERLGFFAHELRNLIQNATLALTAIKAGNVGLAGATGAVLDRSLIGLRNLLQNAFKFTEEDTEVSLRAHAAGDRVMIEVEDNCGGLPPGDAERMFEPFTQGSTDKSGLRLGLSICRRSVEAIGGVLSVRNMPGVGCVFTVDLPRHVVASGPSPAGGPT